MTVKAWARVYAAACLLVLVIALAACADTPPAPAPQLAEIPAACDVDNPGQPPLRSGEAPDVLADIGASDDALKRTRALRDECRASLVARNSAH